jgi:hypothetical protein
MGLAEYCVAHQDTEQHLMVLHDRESTQCKRHRTPSIFTTSSQFVDRASLRAFVRGASLRRRSDSEDRD